MRNSNEVIKDVILLEMRAIRRATDLYLALGGKLTELNGNSLMPDYEMKYLNDPTPRMFIILKDDMGGEIARLNLFSESLDKSIDEWKKYIRESSTSDFIQYFDIYNPNN